MSTETVTTAFIPSDDYLVWTAAARKVGKLTEELHAAKEEMAALERILVKARKPEPEVAA